jgi:formylglycine-generating enzyme required for sulfatase activity
MKPAAALVLAFLLAGCGKQAKIEPPTDGCAVTPDTLGRFVRVPEGKFVKGAGALYAEESPEMTLHVSSFEILDHEVTNLEFTQFVEATGYVTEAEQGAMDGRAGGGSAVFMMPGERTHPAEAWRLVAGASWRAPEGPGSDITGRELHPVVHVSLADARAYADWAGGRLPDEVEWEYAASLGLADPAVPVSGAFTADGTLIANTWQGMFPLADTAADGFAGRAPAGCFPPSVIGLFDMIGNVWEWTETPFGEGTQTIKGGSYLCADNYCRRYRPAARHPQEVDFSSSHIGFRIVRDLPSAD